MKESQCIYNGDDSKTTHAIVVVDNHSHLQKVVRFCGDSILYSLLAYILYGWSRTGNKFAKDFF